MATSVKFSWSPQNYLDICCQIYQNQTALLVSTKSYLLSRTDINNIPIEKFPLTKSCCLLNPSSYDIDILTNNLIPIYNYKSGFYQNKILNDSSSGDQYDYDDSSEPDFSNLEFPNDIWNTRPEWEIVIKTIAVVPLVLLAIIGNLTVIRIVLKARLTKNPVNLFILNMSIADLLNALIFPWIFLVSDFYQRFVLGKIICKLEGFVLSKSISLFNSYLSVSNILHFK